MKIRVLIVDDELPARQELKFLLKDYPEIEVAGEADSGQEALELAQQLEPELVFLDIQLHDMSGLEVAKFLARLVPRTRVIFVTAYDQYAIEAFELHALDYLLKPVNKIRLQKTIQEWKNIKAVNEHYQILKETIEHLQKGKKAKIPAIKDGRILLINQEDILYIKAEGRNAVVRVEGQDIPTNFSLCEIAQKLNQDSFLKVHRSYIVNLEAIVEIIPWFKGTYNLIFRDKEAEVVPVSRSYVNEFREKLGLV